KIGDQRRSKRLVRAVDRLAAKPGESLPAAMVTSADQQGTYRLLNADDAHPQEILSPHIARTRQRCAQRGTALLVHDTTTFTFSSPRAGLGRVNDGGQGFLGHFCLAVGLNGAPLGLLGFERLV